MKTTKILSLLILCCFASIFQYCKSSKETTKTIKKVFENPVTYTNNIKPIMLQKCTPCHFPERGRKKMLNTFSSTKENIKDIMNRVQLPIGDKKFMPFKNKRPALTKEEIQLLSDWIAQSMPE